VFLEGALLALLTFRGEFGTYLSLQLDGGQVALPALLGSLAVWALILLACWFSIAGTAYAVAMVAGWSTIERIVGGTMPSMVRSVVQRLAGVLLSITLLSGSIPAAATAPSGIEAQAADEAPPADIPHAGIRRLLRTPAQAALPSSAPAPQRSREIHIVKPGDSLWRIAATHLDGHPTSTLSVGAYWRKVIEANRDHLRSGDPNLIFPGEVIRLPGVAESL